MSAERKQISIQSNPPVGENYDAIVIGGGVVGSLILRELVSRGYRCALFERNSDLASGASRANSAIIHAGFDPVPGTLKAELNVRGASLYPELASLLDIPYRPVPSLVTAFSSEEIPSVENLLQRGRKNGVQGLKILNAKELREIEPHISGRAQCALFAPSAIVEPWTVAIAAAENAADNGADVFRNATVTGGEKDGDRWLVSASVEGKTQTYEASAVINAAGLNAETVHAFFAKPTYHMIAKRGQYYILDKAASGIVRNVLFPCPSEKGKGVLIFPEIHGRVMIGPDSEKISGSGTATTAEGLSFIKKAVENYLDCPIPYGLTIRSFAGVRPASDKGDFILGEVPDAPGFFDAAGIESPGLASSPAIAERIGSLVEDYLGEKPKEGFVFVPARRPRLTLERAVEEGLNGASRIVCRCEKISEAMIVDSIHRNVGARTVKGVKMRVSAGTGGCQGGYCQPEVLKILARELGISPEEVLYDEPGSQILTGKTR